MYIRWFIKSVLPDSGQIEFDEFCNLLAEQTKLTDKTKHQKSKSGNKNGNHVGV